MIFEKIKNILMEQLDLDESQVTMEANIAEDLGADSLDVVDIAMTIEEEFEVEIPDEAVEGIRTVGDIVRFVEENKA